MTQADVEKEIGVSFREIFHQGPSGLRLPDMTCAYETADAIKPKILVEIGAGYGISTVMLGLVAKKYGGHLYSVEHREKPIWRKHLEKRGISEHVTMIHGRNPWLDWPSLKHIRPVDYLLIDGYHDLFSVTVDYCTWGPRVRKGGRIAFHDYYNGRAEVATALSLFEKRHQLEFVKESWCRGGLYVVTRTGKYPTWR